MTTTTVSQEAREAAASILPSIYGALYSPAMGERCVRGILDEGFLVQAFHKFEQSIRQQAERGEVVAWMYERGEHRVVVPLSERASHMTEHGWTETPLYTLPTPPEAV